MRLCEKLRSWKGINCSNLKLHGSGGTAQQKPMGIILRFLKTDLLLTDELCLCGSWLNIVQEELEAELDQAVEAFPRIESKRSTICMCGAGGKWDAGLNRSSSKVLLEF